MDYRFARNKAFNKKLPTFHFPHPPPEKKHRHIVHKPVNRQLQAITGKEN